MGNIFIGIDHGGTNTTALVLSLEEGILSTSSVPMPKKTPREGWVEHNPDDFLHTSIKASSLALEKANLKWGDVYSVAIANQGETSMAWSKNNKNILGPAISWEDKRTEAICKNLADQKVDALVRNKTGILLDPYFSASKFNWLLNNVDAVKQSFKEGSLRLGGTDTYVIDRLTDGEVFATDPGTASRTSLQNIRDGQWDLELLEAFRIDQNLVPQIKKSADDFGVIKHSEINSSNIKISGDIVDAHAALFAHGCVNSKTVKATYGTGAFIEINTEKNMLEPDGLLPIFIAWELDKGIEYTIEGGVFSVGSAIDWCFKNGFIKDINKSAEVAESVKDDHSVSMIPSFTGLSAPHWISNAKGIIHGLSLDSSHAQITKAVLDGISFQCSETIKLLIDKLGTEVTQVCADGGPSNNKYLMQKHADLLGLAVNVSQEKNMTAYGAALIAAFGAGQISVKDIESFKVNYDTYVPKISDDEREGLWEKWNKDISLLKSIYIK